MIRNIINDKKYIGQDHDIKWRWSHHICDLNNNQHHNKHLQNSWNKYGSENFEFSIIEETTDNKLNEREIYWIKKYDSYNNGYNNDYGGAGCRGFKHSEEEIGRMRKIQNPNVVLEFDSNYNLINRWDGGISHISKSCQYTKECVDIRCKHTIKKMSPYKGSYWVFEKEYNNPDFTWEKYFNNISLFDYKKPKSKIVRKICQYSIDKKLIRVWDSLADIRKEFGNTSSVSAILYHRKNKKTAYGYIWTFQDYDFSDGYFDTLEKYYNKATENKKRKVQKIDINSREVLTSYNSLTEAVNDNDNIKYVSNITVAAKGFPIHQCGGYLWRYIE